jgi:peptidoglycan/xylan/chitin deacetylase (PgdA/CDA1 family)
MKTPVAPDQPPWTRKALLVFAFIAPVLSLFLLRFNVFVALAPIFLSHVFLLYATLVANCQWFGPVIRSFETAEPEVWLTIDDGPSPAHTPAILDLLDRFDARATFFVIGKNAEQYPHLITAILTRGHEIANHTYTHPSGSFWMAGPRRIAKEIDRCAEHLRSGPDRRARFFRAPVGLKNLFVHPELESRGLALVGWSVRGLDTIRRDSTQVANRVLGAAKPGAIVVLHEGHRVESDPEFNLRCLEQTLTALAAQGYGCVIPAPGQLRTHAAGK